jgi:N-acetylneuraminate synthase
MGITSLERHITLSRAMYGSDQSASIEPHGIQTLVEKVREIEKAMGDGIKRVIDAEAPVAANLRQHLD